MIIWAKSRKNSKNRGFIQQILILIIALILVIFLKDTGFVQYFWNSFINNFQKMAVGQQNDLQLASPMVTLDLK